MIDTTFSPFGRGGEQAVRLNRTTTFQRCGSCKRLVTMGSGIEPVHILRFKVRPIRCSECARNGQ